MQIYPKFFKIETKKGKINNKNFIEYGNGKNEINQSKETQLMFRNYFWNFYEFINKI